LATLEDLKPATRVEGLVVGVAVTVVATTWHGADTLEVVYRTDDGAVDNRLLSRSDELRLSIASKDRHWTLDADGELFKLASEARRIELAHLFDPYVAIETADIDPLPHQIEAVYQEMLPRQPLRFLLADDPGAGKTIMSGLYIRELSIRGDADRVLVVAPGSLVEQWQDELWQRFQLPFDILSRDMIESARTGNPFVERSLLIARVDQLARNEDLQVKLRASDWDLVVVDEAHKMAARYFGSKLEKTKRYQVGEPTSRDHAASALAHSHPTQRQGRGLPAVPGPPRPRQVHGPFARTHGGVGFRRCCLRACRSREARDVSRRNGHTHWIVGRAERQQASHQDDLVPRRRDVARPVTRGRMQVSQLWRYSLMLWSL
jgi:hypothetical protein